MLAIRYIHKNCFLHPGKIIFAFLEARWPADMRFWSTQEAFLRRPTWLQKVFEALQSASKHQSDVTNLCFGSILFKKRFLNDVSHENPIFVLSCRLQGALESLPGGYREAFKTLWSTFKHLQDVTYVWFSSLLLKHRFLMDVSNENPIFDVSESGLEVFFSHQETSLRRPRPVLVRLEAVLEPRTHGGSALHPSLSRSEAFSTHSKGGCTTIVAALMIDTRK